MGTRARELAWLVAVSLALLLVMVWPYLVDGYRFGVGPDVPVYLWWTRVGAAEGLSQIGSRPGAPALAATLAGVLNLNAAAVTAALPAALGVAAGTAAAVLVRVAGGRYASSWWLAGLLTGVFSVHLVAGYVANLIFAVTFLAAAACLAADRRSWGAAALLLAGGGLAHPPFLVHGIVVLVGAAALAWRAGARDEARDVVLAAGLGGLVAGAGVLATVAGPGPIAAETSKDAFLRRAGLDASLVDAYRERFRLRAARYVQWIAVPLAIVGVTRTEGFLRRFLTSWLVVMAIGIPLGWITGWFPPDRLVTFGFAVPIAAALGAWWIVERLSGRRALALSIAGLLIGWMIVGALLAWFRQDPFVSVHEGAQTADLMAYVSAVTGPGTPIVALVDGGDTTSTFLAARAANVLRAAAPPDRANDIYVVLGTATDYFAGRPTQRGDPQFDAVSRSTMASIPPGDRIVVATLRFYRDRDVRSDPRMSRVGREAWASIDGSVLGDGASHPSRLSWGPASASMIALATLGALILLALLGLGYAIASSDDVVTAIGTAPAFGAAAVSLAAVGLDAIGLRLQSVGVAIAAAALAGVGGLAWYLVAQRRRRPQTAA